MKRLKKIIKFMIYIALFIFVGVAGINIYMTQYAKPFIYENLSDLPEKYTVIVPGAKVYQNSVSHVVMDRLDAAHACMETGKAQRILISGDHGRKNYDEVNQMRSYMQRKYAPDKSAMFLDHAGFSTYETMYRARDIFCVDNAVIVTQKFHTARSIYIARKLGLDAVAYEAPENVGYAKSTKRNWEIRETFARVKTFFLVLFRAKPTYLGDKIPITGSSFASWDMTE